MQKLKRIKKWQLNYKSCYDKSSKTALLKPVILTNCTKKTQPANCRRNQLSGTPLPWSRASTHAGMSSNYSNINSNRSRDSTSSIAVCWHWLPVLVCALISLENITAALVKADTVYASTTPLQKLTNDSAFVETTTTINTPTDSILNASDRLQSGSSIMNATEGGRSSDSRSGEDSIFMQISKRLSTGNELWDGIIRDCYQRPSFSCFQKNVYLYLNDALEAHDVNVTQRLKFFKNQVAYEEPEAEPTEAAAIQDEESAEGAERVDQEKGGTDEQVLTNEIPSEGRAAAETPIEEVTSALYGKSIKFAMTHDIEINMPETLFDGATFRISPRSFEGNGIIAKLELIPKQEIEARLAGKLIMKKIQKFFKSKMLMSFLALVLIVKIIKIKLFWLLPLVIGVGAAKKLLLKFLLFLFPALSHLFKLCSYYQQTFHSTKYHHHHHLINHHHTIVPEWHSAEHSSLPEIIYTHPPKGHVSAYLHGAPIHENYGAPSRDHYDSSWQNSGPGLGSEYISDINRAAQIDGNPNYFKPHTHDANEINAWGLGTTQSNVQQQQQQLLQQRQRLPATQQQKPPPLQRPQQQQTQPQHYQKPHATSHSFNPFLSPDKQSIFSTKMQVPAQSAPRPVYTPVRNSASENQAFKPPVAAPGLTAAQIAAQYEPTRNNPQQQSQTQLSPEVAAQLKEAIRIQAEQRIIAQQQKILDKQPFVQDGQPLMPKNYDPFYSPILQKIDKIVEQLGVTDDLCKERVVCSMYKDPARYSPHSNFVSAELSRDTNELQPVSNTNEAVIRFYRLIQAARDGQDQKDCLRVYSQCSINTE